MPRTKPKCRRLLDRGEVQAVVRVLPGFARDLARGRTAAVQVLVDGTNSNTASLVSSYAGQIVARVIRREVLARAAEARAAGARRRGGREPRRARR